MSHAWIKTQSLSHARINMDILENPMEWLRAYQVEFLDHFQKTGEFDWDKYVFPVNNLTPRGHGVDLSKSRLLVITSSGAYLKTGQQPFNFITNREDYTIRMVPTNVSFNEIGFSCLDPDPHLIQDDPQVVLPLRHLHDLVIQQRIGALLPMLVSHCNFQPHAIRVVKELVPSVLNMADELNAQAALLLPTGLLSNQTAGLVARALEVNGIASVVISNSREIIKRIAPPRALLTDFSQGKVMGEANDEQGQWQVLLSALSLLEQEAPLTPVIYENPVFE